MGDNNNNTNNQINAIIIEQFKNVVFDKQTTQITDRYQCESIAQTAHWQIVITINFIILLIWLCRCEVFIIAPWCTVHADDQQNSRNSQKKVVCSIKCLQKPKKKNNNKTPKKQLLLKFNAIQFTKRINIFVAYEDGACAKTIA